MHNLNLIYIHVSRFMFFHVRFFYFVTLLCRIAWTWAMYRIIEQ